MGSLSCHAAIGLLGLPSNQSILKQILFLLYFALCTWSTFHWENSVLYKPSDCSGSSSP